MTRLFTRTGDLPRTITLAVMAISNQVYADAVRLCTGALPSDSEGGSLTVKSGTAVFQRVTGAISVFHQLTEELS